MNRVAIPLVALIGLAAIGGARPRATVNSTADPLGPNAACYVCHTTFVREELSKTHLAKRVTCVKCHGLSAKHANDENVGATQPDRSYAREQVNAMCRRCHKRHGAAPEQVAARGIERGLTALPVVCTDCHGTHRIERAEANG